MKSDLVVMDPRLVVVDGRAIVNEDGHTVPVRRGKNQRTDVYDDRQVIRRILFIILDTSPRRSLNKSEISRKLDIPKSSAHVIMLTLERLGYVQKKADSLNYSLGLRAYGLGLGMMKNLSISEIAVPHMRVLVDQLRLPAHLAVPNGDQGVYIQKVDAPGLIKIDTYVGRRMDLHCTGVGKVILEEEELAVRCIAVPVRHPDGRLAAGLSVVGTTEQIPLSALDAMADRLKETAAAILTRVPPGQVAS